MIEVYTIIFLVGFTASFLGEFLWSKTPWKKNNNAITLSISVNAIDGEVDAAKIAREIVEELEKVKSYL